MLESLEPSERAKLYPMRAVQWHGPITIEQYIERNHRLDRHEFGRSRCHSYAWREKSAYILSSMDTLDITLGVRDLEGNWSERPAVLIASVITAPENRGHGYAGQMLAQFFARNPAQEAVLYSDIGPSFYQRFGFVPAPRYVKEVPAAKASSAKSESLTFAQFSQALGEVRRRGCTGSGAAVLPDPSWLDWHAERYRAFAEFAGRPFPKQAFWRIFHGRAEHLFAAFPHFLSAKLEGFWVEPRCAACIDFGRDLASQWGLSGFCFWTDSREQEGQKEEWPMVRLPRLGGGASFHDPQLCDWW